MKHPYDPRTQLSYIVWHNDPNIESCIRHLIETTRPSRWVETGTHMGWTSHWVAENYPWLPIFTVEVDPEFHAKASENLAPYPWVFVKHGHSVDYLRDLFPILDNGLSIFWLDAHWWPPVPLRGECEIISRLNRYVCVIDDFSCWEPDFSGDTFFSVAPSGGDAYLNDLSYVASELGDTYWRPNWPQPKNGKGIGLFQKGVPYEPPVSLMKRETLDEFLASRERSIERRRGEKDFVVYPTHPSSRR